MTAQAFDLQGQALPLRPYQTQAKRAIYGAAHCGITRQLVVLPTGSGKTVVFAHLVLDAVARGRRALILAHRDELISQAVAKLLTVAPGLDIGVVKADRDEHDAAVVVASVATLKQPARLERFTRDSLRLIVVDEAHHAVADTYRRILDSLGSPDDGSPPPLVVGFTATAQRADKIGLGAVFEDVVYQRGILAMIAENYLTDVRALSFTADLDLSRVKVSGGDFADESLGLELTRSRSLEAAAVAYRRYASDRKGVAFCPTIATSKELARLLSAQGIPAEHLDGNTPTDTRRGILRRLRAGDIQVVANCNVLTEGWDEPSVSCALMCRPTKSVSVFVQMAGRVLRPHPGKGDALILDVAGSADLGLSTVADLAGLPVDSVKAGESLRDAGERILAEQQHTEAVAALKTQQVELFRKSNLRWLPAGAGWALTAGPSTMLLSPCGGGMWNVYRCQRYGAPVLESGKPLPLDWAQGVGEEIARSQGGVLSLTDARWRSRRVSDGQRRALWSIGIRSRKRVAGMTAGEASDLIVQHNAEHAMSQIGGTE